MQTVGKVKLLPAMFQTVKLPKDARFLSIQVSDGNPYVITLIPNVDDKELIERKISTYTSGMKMEDGNRVYIGTATMPSIDKKIVEFHVFEEL